MEQRLHKREPVELTVRLIQEGRAVVTAKAVDMSQSGLGIEVPELELSRGQVIGVDFIKPGYPRGINCCYASVVAHAGSKGVGLMFTSNPDLQLESIAT